MAWKTPEYLIENFRKDWEAALNPDVDHFMARCHPERREEFSALLEEYLIVAPTPPYSPVQWYRIKEQVEETMGDHIRHMTEDMFDEYRARGEAYEQQPLPERLRRKWAWTVTRFRVHVIGGIRMRVDWFFNGKPWERVPER